MTKNFILENFWVKYYDNKKFCQNVSNFIQKPSFSENLLEFWQIFPIFWQKTVFRTKFTKILDKFFSATKNFTKNLIKFYFKLNLPNFLVFKTFFAKKYNFPQI